MNKGFDAKRLTRLRKVLGGHVEAGVVPGLVALVARGDEVQVEALGQMSLSGPPMRRDTIFRIASMTKPVAAAAAMILVEECRLRLDEPVDAFLPELANRRVLKHVKGPIDDTVPAKRPITLRDLLTLRLGIGHIMDYPDAYPIMAACHEHGLLQGPPHPSQLPDTDEWMRRLGSLPLMYQPGEHWLYDLGIDVLGVLIARASGQSFGEFLQERLFAPLGMRDTGFWVPADKLNRLAEAYSFDPESDELALYDSAAYSEWSKPPAFESGGGGLVSTVDDYLAFCRMLLNKGQHGKERILSRPAVELMTSDQLTPEQRTGSDADLFFNQGGSWAFGMSVVIARQHLFAPGRFGWDGGLGTSAHTDPAEGLIGILMTQRVMNSPLPPPTYNDFWTLAYQAIAD